MLIGKSMCSVRTRTAAQAPLKKTPPPQITDGTVMSRLAQRNSAASSGSMPWNMPP